MPIYGDSTFASAGITLLRAGRIWDGRSTSWEELYFGTSAGITAKYNAAIAAGAKARISNDNGTQTLTLTYALDPNDLTGEVPEDEWSDDTETAEVDLFAWAPAVNEAAQFVAQSTTGTEAAYRKEIKDAVDNGETYPLGSGFPVGQYVYKLLARGVTSIPFNRPVLSRNRTFSTAYENRNQMQAVQTVWTTSALISAFDIPTAVQARLPENPGVNDTPEGTAWGWKLTVDRASYNIALGKVTEQKTWVFAAWVTSFFNFVQ
jgi:hypothetical protein